MPSLPFSCAMRPRMVPSVRSRGQSAMGAAGRCNQARVRTKLVEEGGQLSHPKLNGLGEVTLLPVDGLVTADVWGRYPWIALRPQHLQPPRAESGARAPAKAQVSQGDASAGTKLVPSRPAAHTVTHRRRSRSVLAAPRCSEGCSPTAGCRSCCTIALNVPESSQVNV